MAELAHPSFPLSSAYDEDWLLSLDMGPNPLWLLEDLLRDVSIPPGSRVLDLGSGRAATSVFLAEERGVEVWAADLWIGPSVVEPMLGDLGLSDQSRDGRRIESEDPARDSDATSASATSYRQDNQGAYGAARA